MKRVIPEIRGRLEEYCDARREVESWSVEADNLWESLIGTTTELIIQGIHEQPDVLERFQAFVDEASMMAGLEEIRAKVDNETFLKKVAELLATALIGGAAAAELRADDLLSIDPDPDPVSADPEPPAS
jgi:hypothetical protein